MSHLPRELVSLVHNIQLNRVGWWDKAIQTVISVAMLLSDSPLSVKDIADDVNQLLGVDVSDPSLRSNLEALRTSGIVVELEQHQFKISETARESLLKQLSDSDSLNARVQNRFVKCLMDLDIDSGEALWQVFDNECLFPAICDQGARAYSFLTGKSLNCEDFDGVDKFIEQHGSDNQLALRKGIIAFLDPKDMDIRRYILGNLRAAFVIKSANLDASEIASLAHRMKEHTRFIVFADTNFLFSLLDLHENPFNESARYLVDLAAKLAGTIDIKFYVLPQTVKEMQMALTSAQAAMGDLRLTASMLQAAATQTPHIFPAKYVELARSASGPISMRDFLDPYVGNLVSILRNRGLEIYNDKRVELYTRQQPVLDDIDEQLRYEKEKFGRRAKTYEQLAHDMILWHFTRDKRDRVLATPLEAQYWMVTVDHRLISFDSYKTRTLGNEVPICMTPAMMINVLQFWTPRTANLDQAIVSSLRPLFCGVRDNDNDVEHISIAILRSLSRYEDVGDLPPETVISILTNDALRQRIGSGPSDESRDELVQEAIIQECVRGQQEASSLRQALHDAQASIEQYEGDLSNRDKRLIELDQQTHLLSEQLHKGNSEMESQRVDNASLAKRIEDLERENEAQRNKEHTRHSRCKYSRVAGLVLVLLLVIGRLSTIWITRMTAVPEWKAYAVAVVAAFSLWVLIVDGIGSRNEAVSSWKLFELVHRVRTCAKFLIRGLVISGLYDLICWLFRST